MTLVARTRPAERSSPYENPPGKPRMSVILKLLLAAGKLVDMNYFRLGACESESVSEFFIAINAGGFELRF